MEAKGLASGDAFVLWEYSGGGGGGGERLWLRRAMVVEKQN